MLCPKCGADVPDWSKFCLECGSRLAASEQRDEVEPDDAASHGETRDDVAGTGAGDGSQALHSTADAQGDIPRCSDEDSWASVKPISPKGDLVFKPLQYPERVTLKTLPNRIRTEIDQTIGYDDNSPRRGERAADAEMTDETIDLEAKARQNGGGASEARDHADSASSTEPAAVEAGAGSHVAARPVPDQMPEAQFAPEIPTTAMMEDSITICEAAASDGRARMLRRPPEVVGPEALEGSRKNARGKLPFVAVGAVVVVVALFVLFGWISAINAPIEINMNTFPDEGLRNAVLALDDDGDGKLRRDQIPEITSLDVERAVDISGLQVFTSLQTLEAYGSQLATVDVSGVESLTTLTVCNSGVKTINASGLSNLRTIDAHDSHLASIDLTGTSALETLNLQSTSLGQVDISSCTSLTSLQVSDNVEVSGVENTGMQENWTCATYSSGDGSQGGSTFVSAETKYDDDGKISEVVYADEESGATYSYAYDDQGRLVSLDEYPTDESEAGSAYRLSYDDSGRLANSENATTGETYTYHYDESGRISGFGAYIANSRNRKGMYERGFAYDTSGNLTQITGEDPATLAYDEAGRLTSFATEDGVYAYEFAYDEEGRCVQATITLDGGTCTEKFEYNSSGKMVNATRTLGEDTGRAFPLAAVTSTQFTYDEHGNLVSLNMYDGDEQVGWCNFSYKRSFTSKDHAPVGMVPVQTDPLWYTATSDCLWMPWAFQRQSDESQDAIMMVFDKDQVWMGSNNPIFR